MPTGYTCDVQNGKITTLREYALTCVRAFGVAITLRDEPLDTPLPDEFIPETKYHEEQLKEATKNLNELLNATGQELEQTVIKHNEEVLKNWVKSEVERETVKIRYNTMIDKVMDWQVPDALKELKDFMRSQLIESRDHDCYKSKSPKDLSIEEYKAEKLTSLSWSVNFHTKEIEKEKERVRKRNEYLKTLKDALKEA